MESGKKLILYRDFVPGKVFEDFTWLMEHEVYVDSEKEKMQSLCYEGLHELVELSASQGFEGNLWQNPHKPHVPSTR